MKEIGAIIGLGDTLDAAVENAKEVAATIKGFGIDIPDGSIDKAKEQIAKLAEFGLDFFDIDSSEVTK
jgi:predicted RNase H-like HicB family nuclease